MVGGFKVRNVLGWLLGGLAFLIGLLPGAQPFAVMAGIAAGAVNIANSVTNLVENHDEGTANGWNIASNVLGIVGSVISPIGGIAGTVENVVAQGVSKGIGALGGLEFAADKGLMIGEMAHDYKMSHTLQNTPNVPTRTMQGATNSNYIPSTATFGSTVYGDNTNIYSQNTMFGKYDML
jgi:hypothetical protein